MAYEKLFEAGKIGTMTIKNRAVMSPMATDTANTDGTASEATIAYYQARAKGGIGLIINEYTGVDDVDSIPTIHNLRLARDMHIAAQEKLTDAVHMYDAKIVAQLHHGGATSNSAFTGRQSLAPSAVPVAPGKPVPKEMTAEDIERIKGKFIEAAVRAKKAGYDAVELHAAHGYLLTEFLSRYHNRRTDEYGGSLENRCRFIKEIIEGIREELGPKYPIMLRICGDEMTPVEGFWDLEEGVEIAKELASYGLDAINISAGSAQNADANCEPWSYQPGWKKHVAKAYKGALDIPVIATGTIKDPDWAEQMLEEGICDFVALGRSSLADPDFMNKTREGRVDEIRKCIGCLYCRERVLGQAMPIRCTVNACAAREHEFGQLPCTGKGETVAVVGGGPAGMEAARVLALRGYHVELFEKEDKLGGTMNLADKPPFKDKITRLIETMEAQIGKLDVAVHTGKEVTPEDVKAVDPAGVILALGAKPVVPPLEGVDGPNVVKAEEVIKGEKEAKGDVVIVGSGLTGIETAEILVEKGHAVTIVEMLPAIGPGIFPNVLNDELSRIQDATKLPGHKLLSVEADGVMVEAADEAGNTETKKIAADTVVLALGVAPDSDVIGAFKEAFPTARAIGDAQKGGRIVTAIQQGFEAGYTFQ